MDCRGPGDKEVNSRMYELKAYFPADMTVIKGYRSRLRIIRNQDILIGNIKEPVLCGKGLTKQCCWIANTDRDSRCHEQSLGIR